jgi:hypothetical protein
VKVELSIISETQIDIFKGPGQRAKQQVITYQAEAMAPRTVWVDTDKIPDAQYKIMNPGKPVPADVQAKGDAARRAAIEADVGRIKTAAGPRKI